MYFPVFYSIKALAYNQPVYEYATTKYKNEIWDTVRALWCVWVPAQVTLTCPSTTTAGLVSNGY
jgi:hypothetical protein